MTEPQPDGDSERFSHWSGYTPGKPSPDPARPLVPLDADELRREAARFRRGADRAFVDGDDAKVKALRHAADELDRRAADADGAPG